MEELGRELRASPPSGLAQLKPDELHDLTAALRAARRRQAAELASAGEQALSFVPRLLRGPVRKIVG